ncbi:BZ3500_MvSof-1268-A1-R1_Chr7-3g09687 [Microbotryum saponariae]|uniref:BZ3500_MvSof-1268-A1-R1_Chr7-3g09687 protein n=1 Tax=Microbotryum saponariae TaxID=289078 RepID=A0A2X0NB72_9BASI|nr:BZ3501_MvSof-1269-A2-R1_Chr7-2g09410 [Microbotryum saponariae]SDA02416.1 BZ3500_MvSof-1268-A1-R1_Chr7-3g09687 [Microbotryum saponariae]
MKYSLVLVALVVIATGNVSALPAHATKATSTSQVDDPYFPKEHAVTASRCPHITQQFDSKPTLVNCQHDKCTACKRGAVGTCVEQCASWKAYQASHPGAKTC